MLRAGLTGGIGSGKSTVSARLGELGAVVLDADKAARAVVEPGTPGLAAITAAFGADVLAAGGSLAGALAVSVKRNMRTRNRQSRDIFACADPAVLWLMLCKSRP